MSHTDAFSLDIVAGAQAFGDGSHPSTQGAKAALEALSHLHGFETALDVGCGSGILALQMAYQWHIPVIACDIEKEAVTATEENAKANQLDALITAFHADGVDHEKIRASAPYDLICCNILAEWLFEKAPDLVNLMQDESILILSGILQQHEHRIRGVYQHIGLTLLQRVTVKDWVTLIWQKQE